MVNFKYMFVENKIDFYKLWSQTVIGVSCYLYFLKNTW